MIGVLYPWLLRVLGPFVGGSSGDDVSISGYITEASATGGFAVAVACPLLLMFVFDEHERLRVRGRGAKLCSVPISAAWANAIRRFTFYLFVTGFAVFLMAPVDKYGGVHEAAVGVFGIGFSLHAAVLLQIRDAPHLLVTVVLWIGICALTGMAVITFSGVDSGWLFYYTECAGFTTMLCFTPLMIEYEGGVRSALLL